MQRHVHQTGRELFQEYRGCMKSIHSRADRLADLIKREVSEILLREVKDPRVAMVTITHATVTSDLKQAKVFFSTMKTGQELADTITGLERAAGFVQRQLGGHMQLRYVPHLSFLFDDTLIQAAHMDKIFRELEEKEKLQDQEDRTGHTE
jgi:ribosome-binding factor A